MLTPDQIDTLQENAGKITDPITAHRIIDDLLRTRRKIGRSFSTSMSAWWQSKKP